MRRRSIVICALLGLVATIVGLVFILNMTNPTSGGPAGILAVLALIYLLTLSFIVLMVMVFEYIYRLIVPRKQDQTVAERTTRFYRRLLAVCATLATMPIFIISLNSIGRLGFLDMVLIAAVELVAVFFVLKKMA